MNKKVMLAIVAFVMAGIILAGTGVGAQLMDDRTDPPVAPKHIKKSVDPISDAECAGIAVNIAAVIVKQGGEAPTEAEIVAKLRAAEAKGRDLTTVAEIRGAPGGDAGTTEWGAPWCPIEPYTTDIYVFMVCGQRVKGALMWDEADNDLDLEVCSCWDCDHSWDIGTLTEETDWVCMTPYCAPCSWVWVYVDHCGSSCCECPPTCQFYWLAIDDDACCFDDCPWCPCGDCGGAERESK